MNEHKKTPFLLSPSSSIPELALGQAQFRGDGKSFYGISTAIHLHWNDLITKPLLPSSPISKQLDTNGLLLSLWIGQCPAHRRPVFMKPCNLDWGFGLLKLSPCFPGV